MATTIESFPSDAVCTILSHCDYATETAFTMTYKNFSRLTRRSRYQMQDLLRIELWPCYDLAGTARDHMQQLLCG